MSIRSVNVSVCCQILPDGIAAQDARLQVGDIITKVSMNLSTISITITSLIICTHYPYCSNNIYILIPLITITSLFVYRGEWTNGLLVNVLVGCGISQHLAKAPRVCQWYLKNVIVIVVNK